MTPSPIPKNPLGPTGRTVAANVQRLRKKHGLAFTELSSRLEALGRPIPTLGLRKIEANERRVDADDLIALSLALGTNPNALLLPPTDDSHHFVTITGAAVNSAADVWDWGRGSRPLPDGHRFVPEDIPESNRNAYEQAFFESNAKPNMQDWTGAPNIKISDTRSNNGDD
ncbi:helix-turn-helix domain-containing protein [Rhodococcoides fascians]|uniref:helix-turn-helix domain-containing protein n=1 Tax=Rhodococcoides fascians TaxID=1828 RepID=UPI00068C3A7F|nr:MULTISPECIES: helix-turn-helix transcriptional regulator [Rhodococcus]OZF00547.1 XRE family transcriptional regulator [Rhodococcus sp. 15-1189-1-1a]OZF14426.1 XRE family transcriptional regulator [Rhodococcus sp. 14-2686-1-2]